MPKLPISIVGGGLAGLSLGIALRRNEVPVTLFEAGSYPRHKVCGEFISGDGLKTLEEIGLMDDLLSKGARFARTASFFSPQVALHTQHLPEPALCISRYRLDALLASRLRALGGHLVENSRWNQEFTDGMVRATGRIPQSMVKGWRWFGLKVQGLGVPLESDLEMHFTERGYVGICRLDDDRCNICGLFRSRGTVPDLRARWRDWLGGASGSVLESKLEHAQFDSASLCSVAGLSIDAGGIIPQREVCIGDSLGMIPPVTGNGMSMAFESSRLSVDPITEYSNGLLSWPQVSNTVHQRQSARFARRLRTATWIQSSLFSPAARSVLFFAARHGMWPRFFAWTR